MNIELKERKLMVPSLLNYSGTAGGGNTLLADYGTLGITQYL